jgi:hypothetical protein
MHLSASLFKTAECKELMPIYVARHLRNALRKVWSSPVPNQYWPTSAAPAVRQKVIFQMRSAFTISLPDALLSHYPSTRAHLSVNLYALS